MFTGIIEEIGTLTDIQRSALSSSLTLQGNVIFEDLRIGDSVAVNGVCLTVTERSKTAPTAKHTFRADVMPETLRHSSLGSLCVGAHVNLERAMSANGRFGGHIVSGHIDGLGRLVRIQKEGNAILYTVTTDQTILKYMIRKGSIAMDGISLTVADVRADCFVVSVIPHTAKATTLSEKSIGDVLNLENDLLGKYVERLLTCRQELDSAKTSAGITKEFLATAGY